MNQLLLISAGLFLTLILSVEGGKGRKGIFTLKKNEKNPPLSCTTYPELTHTHTSTATKIDCSIKSGRQHDWKPPSELRVKMALRRSLALAMKSGPEERLNAIMMAGIWGDKKLLPLLKQGLKDYDVRIVKASANAIEKHKKTKPAELNIKNQRLPLNVSLMR